MGEEEKPKTRQRMWQPIVQSAVDPLAGETRIRRAGIWKNAKLEISTDGVNWQPVVGTTGPLQVEMKGTWNEQEGQAGKAEQEQAIREREITDI